MTRYAQLTAAAVVLVCLEMVSGQDFPDFGAGDFVEDAFDVYSSYLDSLSYYMPDSLIKFFFNTSPYDEGAQTCHQQSSVQEYPNMGTSGTSLSLLLLTFALSFGVLVILMRSMLREKVGRAEAKQLIHREQSGFGIGLSFSQAGRADIPGDENKEEDELDATPGHLHVVKNTADIALVSDDDARKRCCAEHSPSTSPLPFIEDILLDKSGLEDVPCPPSPEVQKEKLMSVETLNTVPERLCEDSLDDSHAFCDVTYQKAAQRKSLSSINECSDELKKSTSHGTRNDATTRAQ